MNHSRLPFWNIPTEELLQRLQTTPQGLMDDEAAQRLTRYGLNQLKPKRQSTTLTLLLAQFQSPIILILIFAAGLSFFVHDHADGLIILAIVVVSGLLGFWQERGAVNAIAKLLAIVEANLPTVRSNCCALHWSSRQYKTYLLSKSKVLN